MGHIPTNAAPVLGRTLLIHHTTDIYNELEVGQAKNINKLKLDKDYTTQT